MKQRGSNVVYCPACRTPHLMRPGLITRALGALWLNCATCKRQVEWEAYL
jgi:endogenous inhibitor of DNA gyrase (YacG/DUF329 family)